MEYRFVEVFASSPLLPAPAGSPSTPLAAVPTNWGSPEVPDLFQSFVSSPAPQLPASPSYTLSATNPFIDAEDEPVEVALDSEQTAPDVVAVSADGVAVAVEGIFERARQSASEDGASDTTDEGEGKGEDKSDRANASQETADFDGDCIYMYIYIYMLKSKRLFIFFFFQQSI